MARYISYRDFDWVLLAIVLLICALGVTQIYSATFNTKFAGAHLKQVYWILAGLAVMLIISFINHEVLLEKVPWMYIASIALLVAVLLVGQRYWGAQRWIRLPGGLHLQPSEWVKLVMILTVARYFADARLRETTWADIIKVGLLVGVPMGLVLIQPDLGTSLTYVPIALMGMFLGGLKFRHAVVLLLLAAVMLPMGWFVLKDYQKARLTSFLDPSADPQGSGYQVIQSRIAVGSGGIWGKGTTKGTQTQGMFLPVPHTDFIFSSFAEEHGFVGALTALLLYFMLLMRLISNAQAAPSRAGTFIVMGLVGVLTFHMLVNVGMVLGFLPVTGIPLPLMSYGGSTTLFMFMALGMVMNIRMRRFVN